MSVKYDSISLPSWEVVSTGVLVTPQVKANLLMALVERVKTLDNVVVKSTTFINDQDEMVLIPGPWAILKPSSDSRVAAVPETDVDELDEVVDVSDNISVSSDTPRSNSVGAPSSLFNRFRSPSTTTSSQTIAARSSPPAPQQRRTSPNTSPSIAGKCVIRNEFGHARIQQYIVHPERVNVNYHDRLRPSTSPENRTIPQEELFETGGHVVLHPAVFRYCVERGWGMKHPLAGHFHPITGTEIPSTTMLFRAPTNEAELEVIWKIVMRSYCWVTLTDDLPGERLTM